MIRLYLFLLVVCTGCSYRKHFIAGATAKSTAWNLAVDDNVIIALDNEKYPIPSIAISLPAKPQKYWIVDCHEFTFQLPRKQAIIVEYQYADHLPNNAADDYFENPIYGKPRQKKNRITKTDTVGKFSIHYLNILPKYMPYLEGTTAKVVE